MKHSAFPRRVVLSFLRSAALAVALAAGLSAQSEIRWRNPEPRTVLRASRPELRTALARAASRPGTSHVILQFDRPIGTHTRALLAASGARLLRPLGAHAYFAALSPVALDVASVAQVRDLVRVQEIEPAHRLHPTFAAGAVPAWALVSDAAGAEVVALYVLFHADVSLDRGAAVVRELGGRVVDALESIDALVVELPRSALLALASEDEVQWVEPPLPRMHEVANDGNRAATQANLVRAAPYDLDGSGVTVMVYDGGYGRASHVDFGGRLTVRDSSGLSNHSTHVAGTIGGNGAASGGTFSGMAPGVVIQSYGFQYDGTGIFLYTNPGDLESDYDQAINVFGADIANNSIGTNTETNGFPCVIQGDYGVTESLIDAIVGGSLGAPFRICWANGNERQGSSCDIEGFGDYYSTAPPATAKNHIAVGATNSNNATMTSFSSWGPTDDGRLKPDVSAPGCQSSGDGGVTSAGSSSDTAYSTLCGTSMATPTVTGLLALLLEDYRVQYSGLADPRNSTLKALLAHTAIDHFNAGPDYQFGYGTVAIKDAIDRMRAGTFGEDELSAQGASRAYSVNVAPGDELRVTLAWDDLPGTPNVFGALVNDLDLVVTDPSGNRHFPWTLDPANPSAPAVRTAANRVDNLEQVFVAAPASGTWRVEVRAYDVPSGPQSYSLVSEHALSLAPALSIAFVDPLPTSLEPGVAHTLTMAIEGIDDSVVGGSATLHVRYDGGAYLSLPMAALGGDLYEVDLPPAVCTASPEFWVSADGAASGTSTSPADAPASVYQATVRTVETVFEDDFQTDQGWSVQNVSLTDGPWTRGVPAGAGDRCDPLNDYDGSGACWLTDNVAGNSDVDGGPTRLLSPVLDLSSANDPTIRYARWFCDTLFDADRLDVEISDDGGASWALVESVGNTGGWSTHSFRVADFVGLSPSVAVRFSATDNPSDSVLEAAIDAFQVIDNDCGVVLDDCNGNGILDVDDIASGRSLDVAGNGVPDECESADCDGDGIPDDQEPDCDGDGLPDDCELDCNGNGTPDECESFADCDGNGVPDECQPDCDGDGTPDACEVDCNENGTPDECESLLDCDGNGIPDECESFTDCDGNGVPDACDPDCDGDGLPDDCEVDCNGNGIPDDCESLADCNGNGIPDECEPLADCNGNGIPDECESFTDCDGNGVPDECQPDCDGDGIPDACEADCDADGVPDDCEVDCNGNGVPDDCEALADCNGNGVPDECESLADCNGNGIPDECESFADCNGNGVPDECDPDANGNGIPDDCEDVTDTVASAEVAVTGTVSGGFGVTQAGDGVYQSIQEVETNGNPTRRRSLLEHKWTFQVPAASNVMLFVRAHHTLSADGDDFVFAWSTDDATYTDAVLVTKTSDDGTYQAAQLPPSAAGTLYVRVQDTDRAQGNRLLDTVFVDHLYVRSSSTALPPVAPSDLARTVISSSRIDLAWLDNSGSEDGFEVERSSDGGASFGLLATVGADVTSYPDSALTPSTTYHYRVRAFNGVGSSDWSNVVSGTTLAPGAADAVADAETTVEGTVTAGSYVSTHVADGMAEALQETRTGGPPSSRVSSLEHVWTFDVQPGSSVQLRALAWHSPNSEGDDFVLAWSTDGATWSDVLSITKTADDGIVQTAALPASLAGRVLLRARDTNRTPGNGNRETLFVDQLVIRTQ